MQKLFRPSTSHLHKCPNIVAYNDFPVHSFTQIKNKFNIFMFHWARQIVTLEVWSLQMSLYFVISYAYRLVKVLFDIFTG